MTMPFLNHAEWAWLAPQACPWALQMAIALGLAMGWDAWLGEPPVRWHPVVWMGRCLQWAEHWVFAASTAPATGQPEAGAKATIQAWPPAIFWRGAVAWVLLAGGFTGLAWGIQLLLAKLPWPIAVVLMAVAFKPMLAWRMLRTEVAQVETALQQSLAQGQQQLARLVSRDTQVLDATQVRESAMESLSENLSDSVVAPLLWFVVLGLPGAVLYRFANTADAMWGYPGERGGRYWFWAGKWAARADDVLSAVPARCTAVLLLASGLLLRGVGRVWTLPMMASLHPQPHRLACAVWREARKTPSPNSGWPMASMALLVQVQLGKPGVYILHPSGRRVAAADMPCAMALASVAVWMAVVAILLAAGGVAMCAMGG